MFWRLLTSLGLVGFCLLPSITTFTLGQRPLRDVPSRELVKRLYVNEAAQAAQYEIRQRMIEVGIYGIDKDRELVEALLETFDGKNIKVMEEAIIALSSARDQAVRRRLIQLLSTQKDSGVRITLLAALAYKDGPWPIDAEDVESIKAIVLEPTDSIDGDFNLKSTAILALGAIGAVKALEDLQKYEGINQALGPNLDAALRRARDVKKNGPDQ